MPWTFNSAGAQIVKQACADSEARRRISDAVRAYREGRTAIVPCVCYVTRINGRTLADLNIPCAWCEERNVQNAWALETDARGYVKQEGTKAVEAS